MQDIARENEERKAAYGEATSEIGSKVGLRSIGTQETPNENG